MKNILLMVLFCLLGFTSRVSADCTGAFTPPHGLPFVDTEGNARTYDALWAQCEGTWWEYIYYQKDSTFDYVAPNINNQLTFYIRGYSKMYISNWYSAELDIYNSFVYDDTVNVKTSEDLYNQARDTIVYNANYQATLQLTVARSPEAGGGVASLSGEETEPNCEAEDGLFCGTCGHNYCVGSAPNNSTVKFGAFPNSGYAFAYWSWNAGGSSSTANPEIFTLSGDLDLVAVFKKTFRDAVEEGFYEEYGSQDPEVYGDGECVTYVKHETGITDISGNANEWYQGAINAGYYTTAGPDIPVGRDMSSAIVVFGIVSEESFPYGHVGIVINRVGLNEVPPF